MNGDPAMLKCPNDDSQTAYLHSLLIAIALGNLCALMACNHQPPKTVVASPQSSLSGEATFTALPDPASAQRELPKNQIYQPPRRKGTLSTPAYPPAALATRFGAATVAVRIVIGEEGKVTGITNSPLLASTPGPFAAEFRAATEEAIRSWAFEPAEVQTLEDGKDLDGDGKPDYQVVVAREKIPVYFDLRFDFNIVGKEGRVQTSGATFSRDQPPGGPKGKEKPTKKKSKKSS